MAANRVARRAGLAGCALLLAARAPAQYLDEGPPPPPAAALSGESAGDALARHVRVLAQRPRDYQALVGAGRAALATGDPQAAIGFFGRAADVSPNAPAPHAGLGAAMVAMGEAGGALPEFDRAQRLGAPVSSFAAERGLARDLLGQQAAAQADYRLALAGPDAAEARRRLALSLAISGNYPAAAAALAPLLQHSDVATNRVRAFILALGGNAEAADRALDASVPGLSRSLDPFFRRLPALSPAQKAAAVHLGIIPGRPVSEEQAAAATGNRLADIEALLRPPPPPPAAAPQVATAVRPVARAAPAPPPPAPRRIWVQLASGTDESALAKQFSRLAGREPEIFNGIRPYVSLVDGRSKLLVGPFRSSGDSEIFLDNLADARIDGFSWTSPEGQQVRRLAGP